MDKGKRPLGVILALALLAIPSFAGFRSARAAHDVLKATFSSAPSWLGREIVGDAFAAEGAVPRIKQMKVSVEPEYDEPRILVIYDGRFEDGVSFPRDVKFRIPNGADISQVCGLSDQGDHLCQLYQTKRVGDYTELTYNLPVPRFYLEYYFNPIGSDAVRNLKYAFSATFPTDKLDFEVQQPLRSTDFTMSPAPQSARSDDDGFKYSLLSYDNINSDQKMEFNISYSKQDSQSSVPKAQQGAAGGGSDANGNLNLWVLLGGLALFAVVTFYVVARRARRIIPQAAGYGGRDDSQAEHSRGAAYAKSAGRSGDSSRAQRESQFCTNCGARMGPRDRFCAACGTRSRSIR